VLEWAGMASTRGWRPPTWAVLAAGSASAALISWATRPSIAADDAAVTFRYAERLATGDGLTYNDGERVLGASSGLHTLLLAAGRWLGASVPSTAVAVGVVGMAVCTALVGLLAARLGGRLPAVVAMFLFLAAPVRWHATGGLESSTLLACCLAAVVLWQAGRERLAGIAIGVALVAKLDAGALLVALVGASLVVRRRMPVVTLVWTAVAAAPWFLWVTWQFGNPLPQSLRSKATGRADAPGYAYTPTWALRLVRAVVPAAVAGVAVGVVRRGDPLSREVRLTLVGWLVLSLAAVSLIPLGAAYPWYTAPLYAPIAVLAGDAVGWARGAIRHRSPSPALVAVPLVLIVLSSLLLARNVVADLRAGVTGDGAALQWEDFRSAGRFVEAEHPGAVLETCFGWAGYAAPSATIADPCAINSPWPTEAADVRIDVVPAGDRGVVPGWCEEVRFDRAGRSPDGVDTVVRARC
jgi:hypothetical protein